MMEMLERRSLMLFLMFSLMLSLSLTSCLRVAEDRALLEERVGKLIQEGLSFEVDEGASAIQSAQREGERLTLELWAQRPSQRLTINKSDQSEGDAQGDAQGGLTPSLELRWRNLMVGSSITLIDSTGEPVRFEQVVVEGAPATRLTLRFSLKGEGGEPHSLPLSLNITPPEPPEGSAWRVGVFADVQERLNGLSDLLAPLGQEPVRFCLISGDLTEQGEASDLKVFQAGLERHLPFPCYATMGNHELGTPGPPFFALFGRASLSLSYGGVRVTLLDDASATIAPRTREKLRGWLQAGRDQLHLVVTHLPLLDADGTRSGAWASRLEATELLAELAQAGVDLLLYGHVHTYKAFKQAGIPAIISGGGGSIPMRFDGVGRHYLVIELDPVRQHTSHRVQELTPSE